MEKNEGIRKPPPSGNNSELEKFKRRLIRAVARMLIHEKRNEEEVWEGLRKQTGCDCKELWNRMHALTIRKLDRLLAAQDRVDLLPRAARMSITDWLMFDNVIAHEEFDVIGMTETSKEDRKVLKDLFDLVEKYKIEFLAGDELADAWSAATMYYNKDNRQCSPMLLQRRWYQFKLATRARFYKFWSTYKGTVKRLYLGEAFKPTPLQTQLAMRYKPLVVKPFMLWEDLVKNKLVILPEEFELKSNEKEAMSAEIDPEVMCIEPQLETIDVDDDSDLEYRQAIQEDKQPVVTVKQEPKDTHEVDIDENVPYENRQEKISHVAEAVMEATAIELDEIELADSVDSINEENGEVPESEQEKPNDDDVTEIPLNVDPTKALTEGEGGAVSVTEDETDDCHADSNLVESNNLLVNDTENTDVHIIGNEDNAASAFENNIDVQKEPEQVLPQITSIFGGVDVSNETLSKIGLLTAQITNKAIIETEPSKQPTVNIDSIDLSNDSSDGMHVDNDKIVSVVSVDQPASKDILDDNSKPEIDVKPDVSKNSWFGELSNDIEFADDGIQFVDDGIDYEEDECAYQMGDIKLEIKVEDEKVMTATEMEEDENVPTVDEKLLMMPVVQTVKLDDMGILPLHLLHHVDCKGIIEIISLKSKPIIEKIDIKSSESNDKVIRFESKPFIEKMDVKTESSDEDTIEEVKKVKLSSVLLQKPRSRTYNPIQLCKNPDFNTRLKKLNVGFFSSARNRLLLKACKPLSVDVSKAFENRLVNGTMYLEASDGSDLYNNIDLMESSQNVSVVPSAMIVQSLMDNTNGEILPVSYRSNNTVPALAVVSPPIAERNKAARSPDISEINRNQSLLSAEVTPLKSNNDFTQVPVTIVTSNNINTYSNRNTKAIAGPASRIKEMRPSVVDITKGDNINKPSLNTASNNDSHAKTLTANKDKTKVPWKPKHKAEIPWYSNKCYTYDSDALLALDSLNKMLCLLTDGGKEQPTKKTKKPSAVSKDPTTISLDSNSSSGNKDDANDDVEVVSETKADSAPVKKRKRKAKTSDPNAAKRYKPVFCCWARERICQLLFSKKQLSKHNCPFPLCLCCCRNALVDFMAKKKLESETNKTKPLDAEPLGCVGLQPISGADAKSDVDISNEMADVVIIVHKNPQVPTRDSLPTKANVEEVKNIDNETTDDVVICNNECNQIDEPIVVNLDKTEEPIVADQNIDDSSDNGLELGAQVIVNTEPSVLTQTSEQTTTEVLTDANIRTKAAKPRFRVMSSAGPARSLEANQQRLVKQPKLVQKRVLVIDPMNPNKTEEEVIKVRRALLPPNQGIEKPKAITVEAKPRKMTPKTYLNQKMIYLNSKQISEFPSDNPIYLGKNKILLTTAKFPANFKAFEVFQSNLKQTMALPKGVQLVLLPSGRLTYVLDSKCDIGPEFMKALPHLIEAIQQQIDATVVAVPSNTQSEVINLSDDELETIENTEKSSESEIPKDTVHTTKSTDTSETSKDDIDQTNNTDKSVSEIIAETAVPEISKDDIIETLTVTPCPYTENNDAQSEENIPVTESETVSTENNETRQNNCEKTKNILSDLMAMSGIEPTDITSTAQELSSEPKPQEEMPAPPTEDVVPIPVTDQGNVEMHHLIPVQSPIQQNVPNAHTSDNDNVLITSVPHTALTSSLTAITSLSELKYACAQFSSFFKLDIDTGVILPINVCMKKFTENTFPSRVRITKTPSRIPNTVTSTEPIDLTDDDVTEVVEATQTDHNSISIAYQENGEGSASSVEVTNDLNKSLLRMKNSSDEAGNININGINISSTGNVKPLKLFKSNLGRPHTLGRKLKEIQQRISETLKTQDLIRRKLKRKKETESFLANKSTESVTIESDKGDSSNESDEEPLAKIAKKMRATEKLDADNRNVNEMRNENANLSVNASQVEVPNNVLPAETDKPINEGPRTEDALTEDEEDMPMECLEESLLEENDPDEDCILGV